MVHETTDTSAVLAAMVGRFQLANDKAATSYLRVADSLGFVEVSGPSVYLSDTGAGYLTDLDPRRIEQALVDRIAGCAEILQILKARPSQLGRIVALLCDYGYEWNTRSQVRYRVRWLEEAGVVERRGVGRPEYRLSTQSVS